MAPPNELLESSSDSDESEFSRRLAECVIKPRQQFIFHPFCLQTQTLCSSLSLSLSYHGLHPPDGVSESSFRHRRGEGAAAAGEGLYPFWCRGTVVCNVAYGCAFLCMYACDSPAECFESIMLAPGLVCPLALRATTSSGTAELSPAASGPHEHLKTCAQHQGHCFLDSLGRLSTPLCPPHHACNSALMAKARPSQAPFSVLSIGIWHLRLKSIFRGVQKSSTSCTPACAVPGLPPLWNVVF